MTMKNGNTHGPVMRAKDILNTYAGGPRTQDHTWLKRLLETIGVRSSTAISTSRSEDLRKPLEQAVVFWARGHSIWWLLTRPIKVEETTAALPIDGRSACL